MKDLNWIPILASALGGLWALFKGTRWYKDLIDWLRRRRDDAISQVITTAIDDTYRDWVREAKHASENGKLTEEQKEQAMNQTARTSVRIALDKKLKTFKRSLITEADLKSKIESVLGEDILWRRKSK